MGTYGAAELVVCDLVVAGVLFGGSIAAAALVEVKDLVCERHLTALVAERLRSILAAVCVCRGSGREKKKIVEEKKKDRPRMVLDAYVACSR